MAVYLLPRLEGQDLDLVGVADVVAAHDPAISLVSHNAVQEYLWRLDFDGELTATELSALCALLAAPSPVDGQLFAQARKALDADAAYLALGSPSQAQAVAQVGALTRQVVGLLRLALREAGQ